MDTGKLPQSRIKRALRSGRAVMVPNLSLTPEPAVVDLIGLLGYECVWVCMEHGDVGYERLSALTRAGRISKLDIVVRIDKGAGGYNRIARPLEVGAQCLIYPHCRSMEEALAFVRDAKFSPMGMRAVDGGNADAMYGTVDFNEYVRHANEETVLIVQIEDKEAVEAVDSIAAVEGIDVLFVGKYDLSQSYGILGQTSDPAIDHAIDAVAEACRKHGKHWGVIVTPGVEHREMLKRGARFNCIVSDTSVLISGLKIALETGMQDIANL